MFALTYQPPSSRAEYKRRNLGYFAVQAQHSEAKKASALLTHSVRNKLHLCIGCKFGASSLVEIEWQISVGCYLLVKQSCEQCRYCYKPFANFALCRPKSINVLLLRYGCVVEGKKLYL